jgi:hypothetical protein
VKKTHVLQIAGGLALAGAGLYIFFRDVDPAQLWAYLRATPVTAVAGGVGLTLLSLYLRTLRWGLILPPSSTGSRRGLFGIVMVGFMVNNLLPARLGEATRVLLLWKRNRFPLPRAWDRWCSSGPSIRSCFFLFSSYPRSCFLRCGRHYRTPCLWPQHPRQQPWRYSCIWSLPE